jgi:molybdopterin-biosynthesis enzyme MoeA-like protein
VTVVTSTNDESALSGVLRDFDEQAPANTYAKSRPRSFGRDIRMNVTLSARGKVREEVDTILEEAQGKLISLLGARNIELLEKKYDV